MSGCTLDKERPGCGQHPGQSTEDGITLESEPMRHLPQTTPFGQSFTFPPGGFVVRDGRIVKLGDLHGFSLERMMRRAADQLGITPDELEEAFLAVAPNGGSPEELAAEGRIRRVQ
jgi:hypothetical protein